MEEKLFRERLTAFLKRQGKDIYQAQARVLLRKLFFALAMIPAVLAVILVRALRPVILIRFGSLPSRRFGHFAINTEMYLCVRDTQLKSRKTWDIFYHTEPITNQQLKKMWDRILCVFPLARWLDRANRWLPGYKYHAIDLPWDRDISGLLMRTKPHLTFTPEEEHQGREWLRSTGISNGTPFICFLSRDKSYLNQVFTGKDWSYHDYRDSNVNNFLPAAEELSQRGYFMLRMGAEVKEPLSNINPMIIDYATKARSEFLDIFLGANCHFYLGDPCGFDSLPKIFRRPLVVVNLIPLECAPRWGTNYLFIPKKLWLCKEKRFLTFREILNSGIGRFSESSQYEVSDIEVVENTPKEIMAVALEMEERLKGTWQANERDEELQGRFWSLFRASHLHGILQSRIGAEFLLENTELLE